MYVGLDVSGKILVAYAMTEREQHVFEGEQSASRAVHVVEGPVRELRELVRARWPLQSKRVALIITIRGSVYQEGSGFWQSVLRGRRVGRNWHDWPVRGPQGPRVKSSKRPILTTA